MAQSEARALSQRADGAAAIAQYIGVKETGTDDFIQVISTADEYGYGVLQNNVLANGEEQSITVVVEGPTKVVAGAAISEGDPFRFDSSGRAVEAKGTLTINPSNATNNGLDYTETDAGRGKIKSIAYRNPGRASVTGFWELIGDAAVLVLSTDGSGVVTETGATAKTLLDADGVLHPLLTVANTSGNDGTGLLIEVASTRVVGNQNIRGKMRGSATGAGSEVDAELIRKAV